VPRLRFVRVVANEFRPSRNFKKVLAHNADIVGEQRSAVPTSEQYSVFRAYRPAAPPRQHGRLRCSTTP
jgi:arginyl-tRNA--protein-N-Asp/Glu arginylyltransferase